jgi:hypothetical protein
MSNYVRVFGAAAAAVAASASSGVAAPAAYGYHGRVSAIEPFSDPLRLARPYRVPYTGYSEGDFREQVLGN